jgi:hypothetical protein
MHPGTHQASLRSKMRTPEKHREPHVGHPAPLYQIATRTLQAMLWTIDR